MSDVLLNRIAATIRVPIQWKDNHTKTLDYLLDEQDAAIAAGAVLPEVTLPCSRCDGRMVASEHQRFRGLECAECGLFEAIRDVALAWDEGAESRQCHCAAWSAGECACGNWPSEPNPYREVGNLSTRGGV